jgi:class 3 adenylate cyclase
LSGIAIHLASRLLEHAHAGEIVASRTVKDLVVGAGIAFEERGDVELRDVPGTWQIVSVSANSP